MTRFFAVVLLAITGTPLHADAEYSLTCNMKDDVAEVYVCNTGSSAEGNNHYIVVEACRARDCDDDYDLMYIYASPGSCEMVGSIEFSESKDFCVARYRD